MSKFWRFIRNIIFVIVIYAVLYCYAMFQGSFMSWFLFFSFLPILLYLLLFIFYPMKKWDVSRNISHQVVYSGSKTKVKIMIRRKLPFPIFYCVCEDVLPQTLLKMDLRNINYADLTTSYHLRTNQTMKNIIYPLFKRQWILTYDLTNIPRGEHYLTTIKLRTGDLFGFIKKEHDYHIHNKLIAYPNVRPVKIFDNFNRFEHGTITSNSWQIKKTNIATGTRPYIPGDKFSWIHWKQSAKFGDMMTKEFEKEKSNEALIILDACNHPSSHPLLFDVSIEICHSLFHVMAKQIDHIGLLSIGEKSIFFPVQQTSKISDIQHHLTKVQQTGNNFSLYFQREWALMEHQFNTILLITNHIDQMFVETIGELTVQSKKIHIIYIQLSKNITSTTYATINLLQQKNVSLTILTEKELVLNLIEVKVG